MANYEILNGNRTNVAYGISGDCLSDSRSKRAYFSGKPDNKYQLKPGEFPIMRGRLPSLFRDAYSGKPYCSTTVIQEEAKIRGYKLPEKESLPYLGSAEDQTNRMKGD